MTNIDTYYCIYCKHDHPADKFSELYPNCYHNEYGTEPRQIILDEYLRNCEQLGLTKVQE